MLIAECIIDIAMGRRKGNSVHAAREIADRTYGKVLPTIQVDPNINALEILAGLLGCSVEDLPPPDDD